MWYFAVLVQLIIGSTNHTVIELPYKLENNVAKDTQSDQYNFSHRLWICVY